MLEVTNINLRGFRMTERTPFILLLLHFLLWSVTISTASAGKHLYFLFCQSSAKVTLEENGFYSE